MTETAEPYTARQHLDAMMSEKDYQQLIVDTATALGWKVFHPFDSRRSAPGFPDLVMVRHRIILFVEVKREKGKLSAEQGQWLRALEDASKTVAMIVRPSQWERLEEILQKA